MKTIREIATWLGLVAPIAYLVMTWSGIPATVPLHYGLNGQPNRFGSKDSLWLLPAISLVLYLSLWVVTLFPNAFNLPVPAGDPRRPRLEAMAIDLMGWMRLEIAWLFGFLTWSSATGARDLRRGLPVWFTPATIALVLGTVAIFLVRSRKAAA